MFQKIFSFIFILLVFSVNLSAQKGKFITPYDYLKWDEVDNFDFDKVDNWNLNAAESKDIKEAPKNGMAFYKKIDGGVVYKLMKSAERFYKEEKYKENAGCMGIKAYFMEFSSENVNLIPKENYKLSGVCSKVAFWLLGRNKNVDFELILQDYSGSRYFLPITKLNFLGWKYFEIHIPSLITQYYKFYPKEKHLEDMELVGFIVTNHPDRYSEELYAPTYIYIDQLEFRADQFIADYPGKEIKDDW